LPSVLVSIALFVVMCVSAALGDPAVQNGPGLAIAASAAPSSSPTTIAPPLPACTYGNVPVTLAGYDDWQLTLVDTSFALPASYVPPDLVDTSAAGLNRGQQIRAIVIPDLAAMAQAAAKAGTPIAVASGYRSYSDQAATFNKWVGILGPQKALIGSARPGHSEHQLGLAIDFQAKGGKLPWDGYYDWSKDTPAGKWLAAHAWQYGFIMSYPAHHVSPAKTCYGFEPWHYRYVGRDEAAAIHSSGLSPREWLWRQQPRT
jgi:D-alanyl-D-alanine carboxypeptidase